MTLGWGKEGANGKRFVLGRVGGSPFTPTCLLLEWGHSHSRCSAFLSSNQRPLHQRIPLPSKRYHCCSTHPLRAMLVLNANKSSPIESHCYHYSRFSGEILSSHHVRAVEAPPPSTMVEGIRVARPLFLFQSESEPLPLLLLPSLLLFSPHHLSIHSPSHLSQRLHPSLLSLLCCFRRHHRHPSSLSSVSEVTR